MRAAIGRAGRLTPKPNFERNGLPWAEFCRADRRPPAYSRKFGSVGDFLTPAARRKPAHALFRLGLGWDTPRIDFWICRAKARISGVSRMPVASLCALQTMTTSASMMMMETTHVVEEAAP
jgi:hypothetical protein